MHEYHHQRYMHHMHMAEHFGILKERHRHHRMMYHHYSQMQHHHMSRAHHHRSMMHQHY